jgi:phosphotransferase family enzyme
LQTSELAQQLLAALPLGEAHAPLPDFFAVPGNAPRWLIPAVGGNPHATLADWSPYRLSSQLKWHAIRAASRMGVLQALPNAMTLQLGNANEIDWRAVGWSRGTPPAPLIYIGTPGLCRKAVIHLLDPASGHCEAIVKVPLCAGARDTIVREAGVLSRLAEEQYPFSPRLVHLDRQRGIATQQFLPGKSGSRRLRPEYWSLLGSLLLRDELTNIADHSAAWHEQPLSSLPHETDLELMESALAELCDTHCLPACWVHGDFAPWNMRRREHGAAALIDWEEAERGGLPLQDAYHFLHMQDFLFGAHPTTHCSDVEPFAKTLGIAPRQCRKLEIAYLFQAYKKCTSYDQTHAEFLLRTLALIVRDRAPSSAFAMRPPRHLRLVSSHPAEMEGVRAELFDALVAQLNHAEFPYCILSGYEDKRETERSDVDIMFRTQDLHRVPGQLARAARSAGARVVQAIQHETTACYFVLARQEGKHIAHLDADCYSDYRRDGHTWMLAHDVIANRRKYRDFHVPAVADEFTYYLIKKVLKQSITSHQLKQLQHLFARNSVACRQRLATFWPARTALLLQRAIVEQRLGWLQGQLPNLLAELHRSPTARRLLRRTTQKLRDAGRFLRRVMFPTGLSLVVTGGDSRLRSELADGLVCNLAPAFRRSRRIWTTDTLTCSGAQIFEVWVARIRSTLVVRTAGHSAPISSLRQAMRWLGSVFARCFTRCDLVFFLRSRQSDNASHAHLVRQSVVCLDAGSSVEQMLQTASRAILQRMALRTEKRLGLLEPIRRRAIDSTAEFRSAGLD